MRGCLVAHTRTLPVRLQKARGNHSDKCNCTLKAKIGNNYVKYTLAQTGPHAQNFAVLVVIEVMCFPIRQIGVHILACQISLRKSWRRVNFHRHRCCCITSCIYSWTVKCNSTPVDATKMHPREAFGLILVSCFD